MDTAQEFRLQQAQLSLALKAALGGLVKPSNPIPELIDLLGYEGMLRFLLAFGGSVMYVPKLSDLTKTLAAATAALATFQERMTKREAQEFYGVTAKDMEACLLVLERDQEIRTRLSKAQEEALKESGLFDL